LVCRDYLLLLPVRLADTDCAEELLFLLRFIITQAHALGMIPFITFVTFYIKHVRVQRF
jgi:hypothetical protein